MEEKKKWYKTRLGRGAIGIGLVFVIIVVIGGSSGTEEKPKQSATAEKKAEKVIKYEIVRRWEIPNGGEGKVIVVDPSYFNESDMQLLGDKLYKDTKNDRNAFIYIYDDLGAAKMRDETDLGKLSTEQSDEYFKHFIGSYTRNINSGYHQLEVYFDTINGDNTKTYKY